MLQNCFIRQGLEPILYHKQFGNGITKIGCQLPEINVNTTEMVSDLMQFQVWYFFFYVGRCPEWVQFRLFLCKAEAADGCGTLSCGLFVAVMSRCFAGTKQMAGAE